MSHPAGEPFVLLDDPAWLMLPDDLAAMTGAGGTMLQWAPRNGSVLTEIEMAAAGQALRPLSPVHAQIRPDGAGGLTIGWTRRSRIDTGWRDHVDQPLGETQIGRARCRESVGQDVELSGVGGTSKKKRNTRITQS